MCWMCPPSLCKRACVSSGSSLCVVEIFKGLRPCRRSSLASRWMFVCTTGQVYAAYAVKHISFGLLVYEWACGFWPRNRSKDSEETGILHVRKECALMVFIKQQVIGRAFPPAVPVNSFNDAGENGFKVKWHFHCSGSVIPTKLL